MNPNSLQNKEINGESMVFSIPCTYEPCHGKEESYCTCAKAVIQPGLMKKKKEDKREKNQILLTNQEKGEETHS